MLLHLVEILYFIFIFVNKASGFYHGTLYTKRVPGGVGVQCF